MADTRLVFYFWRTAPGEIHGREFSSLRAAEVFHQAPKMWAGEGRYEPFLVANGRLYTADDQGFEHARMEGASPRPEAP